MLMIKFLNEEAKKLGPPKYALDGDAGMDLKIVLKEEDREHGLTIYPDQRELLPCGIAVKLPEGHWARITHRSSTERRMRLRVVEGTIDNGYTGPLFIQVHNGNSFPITIHHGDRIAQMIIHKLNQFPIEVVEELPATERGASGFGSTGK